MHGITRVLCSIKTWWQKSIDNIHRHHRMMQTFISMYVRTLCLASVATFLMMLYARPRMPFGYPYNVHKSCWGHALVSRTCYASKLSRRCNQCSILAPCNPWAHNLSDTQYILRISYSTIYLLNGIKLKNHEMISPALVIIQYNLMWLALSHLIMICRWDTDRSNKSATTKD